jgi:predicted dinucleotide-binding enzyme
MTTAVIGTGTLGSVIARLLASGGETLRLSSADNGSAQMLAAEIGPAVARPNQSVVRAPITIKQSAHFLSRQRQGGVDSDQRLTPASDEPRSWWS